MVAALKHDITEFGNLIEAASSVLLLQPDKPDGDSLGSMLALEEILAAQGKTVTMYCAGRVEPYLRHYPGWDRVQVGDDWPRENWDLAILVDTAVADQVARLLSAHHGELARKLWVRLDHHTDHGEIDGLALDINVPSAAATGELIFYIAEQLKLELTPVACERLVSSIYADTLNLTTPSVTTETVAAFAALVRYGDLNVSELHRRYREASAFDADLLPVKGQLLERLELHCDGRVALVVVSEELTKAYRERTSLSALVMFEILWARGVVIAAVMSDYGTIIRTSLRSRIPLAGPIAEALGGGGHPQAAAFATEGMSVAAARVKFIETITNHLAE